MQSACQTTLQNLVVVPRWRQLPEMPNLVLTWDAEGHWLLQFVGVCPKYWICRSVRAAQCSAYTEVKLVIQTHSSFWATVANCGTKIALYDRM